MTGALTAAIASRSASQPTAAASQRRLSGSPLRRHLRRHRRELRQDVAAVCLERLLLTLGHQVDVELVDADRLELPQLRDRLLGAADRAEAVADLVGDELAVLAPTRECSL